MPKTHEECVEKRQHWKKSLIAFWVRVGIKCIVVSLLDEPWRLLIFCFFFCVAVAVFLRYKGYKNIKINFNVTAKIFSFFYSYEKKNQLKVENGKI